jgi:hypothetical protein
MYFSFSIGLLHVTLLRHNVLLLRRHFSRVKWPARVGGRLGCKPRYLNIYYKELLSKCLPSSRDITTTIALPN